MDQDSQQYSILIVEDNPGDFFLVQDYLEEYMLNVNIFNATNFEQTKIVQKEVGCSLNIVLLDLSLPDIDRESLIQETLNLFSKIPIIALTGYSDFSFATHSLSMGISDYLIKENITPTILYKSILYNIERFKFTSRLRDSEKKYSVLFHFAPTPILQIESDTGMILDANEAAILDYGYGKDEILKMNFKDMLKADSYNDYKVYTEIGSFSDVLKSSNPFTILRKNGEEIIVELYMKRIQFNGDDVEHSIVIANDITERVKRIELIEEQNKKFKEIAWYQSHVIRAPLARLMGLIHCIQEEIIDPEEEADFLSHIIDSAKELDNVISNVVIRTQTNE